MHEPQGSCSHCSPETVSASKLFFCASPSSRLWTVCLCRFPTFQFGRCAALQSVALPGGNHVKSECRLCPQSPATERAASPVIPRRSLRSFLVSFVRFYKAQAKDTCILMLHKKCSSVIKQIHTSEIDGMKLKGTDPKTWSLKVNLSSLNIYSQVYLTSVLRLDLMWYFRLIVPFCPLLGILASWAWQQIIGFVTKWKIRVSRDII